MGNNISEEKNSFSEITDELSARLDELADAGNILAEDGRSDEALKIWNEALDLLTDSQKHLCEEAVWFYASIGDMYFAEKKYDLSYEYFTEAYSNLSGAGAANPFVLMRYGESFYELGDKKNALEYLLRAYMLAGSDIYDLDESENNNDVKYFRFLQDNADNITSGEESEEYLPGELMNSDIVYRIRKEEEDIIIESDTDITVQDAVCDVCGGYILAVKNYFDLSGAGSYETDYIFLSEDLKIKKVLKEDKGVSPCFIRSPQGKIWVSLSSVTTEKKGAIYLPLYGRSEVKEPVIKSDIGIDYLNFGGKTFGYIDDIFAKKEMRFVIHQFDKNGLFKTRKTVKLPGVYFGDLFSVNGKAYISTRADNEKSDIVSVFEIDEKGTLSLISEIDTSVKRVDKLVGVSEDYYSFVCHTGSSLEWVRYTKDGRFYDNIKVFEYPEGEINGFKVMTSDDFEMVDCYGGVGTVIHWNDRFFVHRGLTGTCHRLLDKGKIIYDNGKNVKIINMLQITL